MIRDTLHKPFIDLTGLDTPISDTGEIILPPIAQEDLALVIKGLKAVRYKARKSLTPGFIPEDGAIDVNKKNITLTSRMIDLYERLLADRG